MRTYGTVQYAEQYRQFLIECEPHVALKLKRAFPKIDAYQRGPIHVKATPETARDLEWFVQRYPLDVQCADLVKMLADQHREREALVERLLASQQTALPFDLALPLREYQKIAVAMALGCRGLLLADDVGLGKTAVAIGMLADPKCRPALYVTLAHLPGQVVEFFKLFAPQLQLHVLRRGEPYDLTRGGTVPLPDVVVSNYHKLAGWAGTLAPLVRSVVFDECQELRREESAKYRAARMVAEGASFRLGMSATPIYNYGGEMFNVMDVLAPDCLGTYSEFSTEWCSWGGRQARIRDPKAFGAWMRDAGLMLRRTRKEVGRELPPITVVPHKVDCDTAALDQVSDRCAELARIILAKGQAYRGEKMQVSEEFSNRMRQATGISKAPYVADFVRLLVESGEQVVLYGWHREVYTIWQDKLQDLHPAMYTGSESPMQKDASKHRFLNGDAKVLLISLRAGAGLDGLQGKCRTVVFGELDWSPGVHEQCIGRVYRDGQADNVTVYYLVADHGADPVISDVLGLKKQQITGLRDPNAALVAKLQVDPNHIKRLAETFLKGKGSAAPRAEQPEDGLFAKLQQIPVPEAEA